MDIKVDSLDNVPEDIRDKFVEWKDGDKTMYVHQQYADDMKSHFRLKGDFTDLQNKFQETKSRLDELSAAEQERQRKQQERDIDDKKKNGKFDEIIADWEKRLDGKEKEIQQLKTERLQEKKQTVVERLASAGTESGRTKLARLIDQDLSFDDNGNIIVLDADGKATSQSVDEYGKKLRDLYPELVKEVQSNGGKGNGGYNSGAGGSKTMKRSEFDKLDHGSRAKFFKDGGKVIND